MGSCAMVMYTHVHKYTWFYWVMLKYMWLTPGSAVDGFEESDDGFEVIDGFEERAAAVQRQLLRAAARQCRRDHHPFCKWENKRLHGDGLNDDNCSDVVAS